MTVRPTAERRRTALFIAFFVTGLSMASWVSRTPAIRDAIDASTAEMGLVIAGLSAGSMVGIAAAGTMVAQRGARFVVLWGMVAIFAGGATVAIGSGAGLGWLVAVGLASFGYGMGSGEIGQNVEGVDVETALGRVVVPGLHGSYSLGIAIGGLLGLAASTVGASGGRPPDGRRSAHGWCGCLPRAEPRTGGRPGTRLGPAPPGAHHAELPRRRSGMGRAAHRGPGPLSPARPLTTACGSWSGQGSVPVIGPDVLSLTA